MKRHFALVISGNNPHSVLCLLSVDSVCQLARVCRVADCAGLPVNIVAEFSLKVQRMINVGKTEFDIVTLLFP